MRADGAEELRERGFMNSGTRVNMARTFHRELLLHYIEEGSAGSAYSQERKEVIPKPIDKTGRRTSFLSHVTVHQVAWRRPLISRLM